MSTRCQIEFICKWKTTSGQYRSEKRTVYRHSNGSPGSMIPDLLEFLRWNQGRNDQPDYAAANWIYWNKRRDEDAFLNDSDITRNDKWDDRYVEKNPNHFLKIGHGVDINNRYHGDIEYLYKVIVIEGFTGSDVISVGAYAANWVWNKKREFTKIGDVVFRYDMTDEQIVTEGKRISDLNDKMKGDE